MPYRNIADRRRVSRESARRRRRRLAEGAADGAEAAADSSPGAVLDAPDRAPAGTSVFFFLGPGDGGRIGSGPPHNDLTDVPGAIEDGPAPLPDDGGFVTLSGARLAGAYLFAADLRRVKGCDRRGVLPDCTERYGGLIQPIRNC